MLSGVAGSLVAKLSDRAQPKAVEGAFMMLNGLAMSSSVGCGFVGTLALKALPARSTVAPKTIASRVTLLIKVRARIAATSRSYRSLSTLTQ